MHRLFLVHNSLTVAIREDTLYDRPYLVAPVVAVKAGVLNGELLEPQEISHFVQAWNNRPVVLTHPVSDKGAPISANSKAVLETMCFGQLLNCEFKDNGLRGELWIDLQRAEQLGGDALLCVERLRTHQPIEVSTGYWCDPEPASGTFDGIEYTAIQHNIRPDHLALLPHDIGACSWENGCGAPRINVACTCQKQEPLVKESWLLSKLSHLLRTVAPKERLAVNIKQSAGEVEDALWDAIVVAEKPGYNSSIHIEAVYPTTKTVVYHTYSYDTGVEGPLYQRSYTIDANGMATLGDASEVVAETRYLPVKSMDTAAVTATNAEHDPSAQDTEPDPTTNQQQGDDMTKEQKVDAYIKANGIDQAAKAGLLLLSDDHISKLVGPEPKTNAELTAVAQEAGTAALHVQAPQLTQAQQDAAFILNSFEQMASRERTDHMTFLAANSPFTPEQLAMKPLEELRTLRQMAEQSLAANYMGRGFPQQNQQEQKTGAPEIESPYPVGVGWVKNNVKIAGTPTQE